jgi:hypothetical protein
MATRTVILIKDFAGKEVGHEFTNLDGILCSNLVNIQKVAVYKEDSETKPKAERKPRTKKVK